MVESIHITHEKHQLSHARYVKKTEDLQLIACHVYDIRESELKTLVESGCLQSL